MQKEDIIHTLLESKHSKVKVAITDIDGVLRGKYMHRDKFIASLESGFAFCNVVFGWDMSDVSYDNVKITGWHTGYPDVDARIDLSTFRTIPWEDDIPFFIGDFSKDNGSDLSSCPRSLLKKVINEANTLGYSSVFSQEYEWFNFRQTSEEIREKKFQDLQPLSQGMFGYSILKSSENSEFFHDLFDLLNEFGIPLEGLHTETGPGVYEAAIQHGDILEAADRSVLFKTAVKEIAYKHSIIASFMAKQADQLPGCSGHVHQSLWDKKKNKNLFYDPKKNDKISDLMRSYIAGQLYCLPHILPDFERHRFHSKIAVKVYLFLRYE